MRRVILFLAAVLVAPGCGKEELTSGGRGTTFSVRSVDRSPDPARPVFAATTLGLLGAPLGQGPLLAASTFVPERTDTEEVSRQPNTPRPTLWESIEQNEDDLAGLSQKTRKARSRSSLGEQDQDDLSSHGEVHKPSIGSRQKSPPPPKRRRRRPTPPH
jgi:hypothetical protein